MRIRNRRPSFPIPQVLPEAVLRSTHLRSQAQHYDERFLVEESNRRIGWPCYPLRKHSTPDVQKVQPHDGLQPAIACKIKSPDFIEKKTRKENFVPVMQSHVSQKLEDPEKEGGTSNSSAASERNVKGPRFSASIVLALQAPSTQPARGKKIFRKQKELPLKKRRKSGKLEIERKQAEMEEAATVEPDRVEEAFNKHDTEMEEAATVKPDRTKEAFNKHENSQMRMGINCLLNWDSSHSSTYDSHGLQQDDDKLVETAALHDEKPNRKQGRLKKDSVHPSMATLEECKATHEIIAL